MANEKKGSGAGKFALGALIGAAVGAVAGLLTAPKSGKETREDIKQKAGEVKDAATEKAKDAKKFAKLIVRSCEALSNAMADFRNCKKSDKFKSLIYQVNELEDEADELYIKLIRQLYTDEREHTMRVIVWTRLLDAMEDCVDQCELVANKMNMVMVKYA